MRVLIDSLVHQSCPSLVAAVRDSGAGPNPTELEAKIPAAVPEHITAEIFDYFLPPAAIIETVRRFRPDLLIVDREWIAIAALLRALLEHDVTVPAPRALLAVGHIDQMAIIEAAHHGFFDLIDLSRDLSDVIEQLHMARQGRSRSQH